MLSTQLSRSGSKGLKPRKGKSLTDWRLWLALAHFGCKIFMCLVFMHKTLADERSSPCLLGGVRRWAPLSSHPVLSSSLGTRKFLVCVKKIGASFGRHPLDPKQTFLQGTGLNCEPFPMSESSFFSMRKTTWGKTSKSSFPIFFLIYSDEYLGLSLFFSVSGEKNLFPHYSGPDKNQTLRARPLGQAWHRTPHTGLL